MYPSARSLASIGLPGILLLQSCTKPDMRAADEALIKQADAAWVQAAQTKQVDAWIAFYSGDAVVLPPNEKIAITREAIRKSVSGLLSLPELSITWQPTKIEVARSGDLGYVYGTFSINWNEHGKKAFDNGKLVEIWKKQPDGGWKCIVDTWNSDVPAAVAAASN